MADDTVAFMDAVGLESAHLVGWSDGAYVGLQVALRNPERVRKLVYIGQNANPAGLRPEALPMLMGMTRETAPPIFEQLYSAVSPDGPEHFGVVFEKLTELWKTDQGIPLEDLRGLSTPTLVVVGDDIVSIEHAADMYRTIPDAQLAVVAWTSHALPMEKPDVLNRLGAGLPQRPSGHADDADHHRPRAQGPDDWLRWDRAHDRGARRRRCRAA